MNRTVFFARVRVAFGPLTQGQVDGFNAILEAWERNYRTRTPPTQLAYALATAWHETGGKMTPVSENLSYSSAQRLRQVWPSRFPTLDSAEPFVRNPQGLANKVYGGRMGNVGPNDGWLYRGRTLVQLTGRDNYARATTKLRQLGFDVDLVKNPDDANRPEIAASILFLGMEEAWFTGKGLDGSIDPAVDGDEHADFVRGRPIINGTDRAETIASHADKLLLAILAGTESAPLPKAQPETAKPAQNIPGNIPEPSRIPGPKPPTPTPPARPAPAQPAASGGFFVGLVRAIAAAFSRKAPA